MKYKVESKCGRKKEIEAFSKCELDGKIVKDFDFKIEEIKQINLIYANAIETETISDEMKAVVTLVQGEREKGQVEKDKL